MAPAKSPELLGFQAPQNWVTAKKPPGSLGDNTETVPQAWEGDTNVILARDTAHPQKILGALY